MLGWCLIFSPLSVGPLGGGGEEGEGVGGGAQCALPRLSLKITVNFPLMATSLQWPLSSAGGHCVTNFQNLYKNCCQAIKQLVISFGSIFLFFSKKVARGHLHFSQGKSPTPDP